MPGQSDADRWRPSREVLFGQIPGLTSKALSWPLAEPVFGLKDGLSGHILLLGNFHPSGQFQHLLKLASVVKIS